MNKIHFDIELDFTEIQWKPRGIWIRRARIVHWLIFYVSVIRNRPGVVFNFKIIFKKGENNDR